MARGPRVKPSNLRKTTFRSDIPKEPGFYQWRGAGYAETTRKDNEHGATVRVYRRGRYLYVTTPGINKCEIRITDRIAGNFIAAEQLTAN